jgi:hypothetical protein
MQPLSEWRRRWAGAKHSPKVGHTTVIGLYCIAVQIAMWQKMCCLAVSSNEMKS